MHKCDIYKDILTPCLARYEGVEKSLPRGEGQHQHPVVARGEPRGEHVMSRAEVAGLGLRPGLLLLLGHMGGVSISCASSLQ